VIVTPTPLRGAYVIEPERKGDFRGFFARTWCCEEAKAHGLNSNVVQCSISFNAKKGTLRGLHYQAAPYEETKLIRCTMGAIFDVIVDLRRDSPAFKKHFHTILSAENRRMLYVPEGCAHGFQTLSDNTEVSYQMSQRYLPEYSRGVRWNDPAFDIKWPEDTRVMVDRDRNYPDFVVEALNR
jgi:dTDP-4-dehydrorhamnose 3,5-epimerase